MTPRLPRSLLLLASLALADLTALADSRMEKSLKLEPGGRLIVDTDTGRVNVRGSSVPGVRVVVTSTRDLERLLRLRFEEAPGSATISARRKHWFSSWFGGFGASVRFEIEVPAVTSLSIHTSGGAISISGTRAAANLHTSGGGIDVRDLIGDLEAETSGGPIHLRDLRGKSRVETSGGGIEAISIDGPLNADTSGGSIVIDRVTGDLKAHSSGGGIHIRDAGGRVDADTSGGPVEASFARGNARGGSLESSGGGITVSIDPSVGLSIDASGNSVRADVPIRIDGEVSRRHLQGTLGQGGEKLRLRTSGGSVRIRPL